MLRALELTNFKPFAASRSIRIAPITLVYGPNSGGKSSLIQSLLLMKQSVNKDGNGTLLTRGKHTDLGTFGSLIHMHDLTRHLGLTLDFDAVHLDPRPPTPRVSPDCLRSVEFTYSWQGEANAMFAGLNTCRYALRRGTQSPLDTTLKLVRMAHPDSDEEFSEFEWGSKSIFECSDQRSADSIAAYLMELDKERVDYRRRRPPRSSGPTLFASNEESINDLSADVIIDAMKTAMVAERNGLPHRIQFNLEVERGRRLRLPIFDTLSAISYEVLGLFESISYLGPLRIQPARHYISDSSFNDTVGTTGEHTPHILHRSNASVLRVNEWFDRFEIPYRLQTKAHGDDVTGQLISLEVTDQRTGVVVSPADIGFGIGQFLPILVEGIVSQGRIICVEQPEIHLHPRLQAHLADLFIDTAEIRQPSRSLLGEPIRPRWSANQWIVETHSETLMLRLQRRIRERQIHYKDICVLYVEPSSNGSTVTELRLDERGEFFDEWPDGFFEEDVRELTGGGF